MTFKDIVMNRYATKSFDGKTVPKEKVDELIELIRYAPSSLNIQPWKIIIITDKETKEKLAPVSWNQPQITSCSHLLIFCADTNLNEHVDKIEHAMKAHNIPAAGIEGYMKMARGTIAGLGQDNLHWAQRQLYLALANAVNGAKSLGFDSCPMEGFNATEYSKILNLPAHIVPTALCPIGYASDTPRPKIRLDRKDIVME